MAIETLTLPRLGETMEAGRVVGWLKAPGDAFRRGETLAEIETDKVTVEMPALTDGRLIEILAGDGSQIAVGAPLARIEVAGEAVPSPAPIPEPAPAQPAAAVIGGQAASRTWALRTRASPLARRLARERGLDLAAILGIGRRGRVTKEDVLALGDSRPRAAGRDVHFLDLPEGRLAWRHWRARGAMRGTRVLIHGFAGDGTVWSALAGLLARAGYDVLAPDMPAHGITTVPFRNLDGVVDAAAAFLDARVAGPVTLVGHSLGALVAAHLATDPTRAIDRLVLIAPAGMGRQVDGATLRGLAAVRTADGLSHLLRRLTRMPAPLSAAQREHLAETLAASPGLAAMADALCAGDHQQVDLIPVLEAVAAPVTVIMGLDDRIFPWDQVANLPAKVAIHLVRDAGHVPFWDRPETVAGLNLRGPGPAAIG